MDFDPRKEAFLRAIGVNYDEFIRFSSKIDYFEAFLSKNKSKLEKNGVDIGLIDRYIERTMEETNKKTKRRELLEEAAELVDGARDAVYGDPNLDFERTAAYWSVHAGGVFRRKLHEQGIYAPEEINRLVDQLFDKHDVAAMMVQLKISRIAWSPNKRDNWADGAGYFACGFDCIDE